MHQTSKLDNSVLTQGSEDIHQPVALVLGIDGDPVVVDGDGYDRKLGPQLLPAELLLEAVVVQHGRVHDVDGVLQVTEMHAASTLSIHWDSKEPW